jgi:hypothetical protein
MGSAHTPGPLRVVEHQHAAGPSYAIKTVNGDGSTGTFVAVLHPRSGGQEVRANADLYAAAPDLLDALKMLLPYVESCSDDDCAAKDAARIRAAIAKAEGR